MPFHHGGDNGRDGARRALVNFAVSLHPELLRRGYRSDGYKCAMPQQAWNKKRERQYEHIKEGARKRGESASRAKEIASRTVNKERARSGEARSSSKLSRTDVSSSRRGGLRSHSGSGGRTYDQLYQEARRKGIRGRSQMTKAQLERAVGHR